MLIEPPFGERRGELMRFAFAQRRRTGTQIRPSLLQFQKGPGMQPLGADRIFCSETALILALANACE